MFTADGKPSDDDPREHGPRLGDELTTLMEGVARRGGVRQPVRGRGAKSGA